MPDQIVEETAKGPDLRAVPASVADSPAIATEEIVRQGKRLSHRQVATILKLAEQGKQNVAIAAVIGCHPSTIGRVLEDWTDTRELARKHLDASAVQVAERAVLTADPLKLLEGIGVIERQAQGTQVAVMIGVQSSPLSPPIFHAEAKVIDIPKE